MKEPVESIEIKNNIKQHLKTTMEDVLTASQMNILLTEFDDYAAGYIFRRKVEE